MNCSGSDDFYLFSVFCLFSYSRFNPSREPSNIHIVSSLPVERPHWPDANGIDCYHVIRLWPVGFPPWPDSLVDY